MSKSPIDASLNNIVSQATDLAELTGNQKLSNKIAQSQKAIHLAQDIGNKADKVLSQVNEGDLLGAGASLLGLAGVKPPTGLQFTFKVIGLPPMTFSVLSFECLEHYSDLYRLSLQLTSSDSTIDVSQVLDQAAEFTLWQDGIALRTISGMVASFAQGDSGVSQRHYFLELRPDLWRTTLRRNARIFQQKTVPEIITTLLSEHGIIHYAFALTQPHRVREFCVQWQESDFDFIQRLSAEEGMFYYFEQKAGYHTVVWSDNAQTLTETLSFPYNLNRTAQLQEKCVNQFLHRQQVRHSSAVLKDYTFKKPDWQAQFSQDTESQAQRQIYEHFDYPGRFKEGEQGKAFTRYRLESLRNDANMGEGQSNIPQLAVGSLLQLSQHPHIDSHTLWQLTEIYSKGSQPQGAEGEGGEAGTYFTNTFKVIPHHQTWRPLQRTKPKVDGPQIATVVGPKGEEIFTDNFGRIRLQFLWDREGQSDDHSSCWIRVTQAWAGQGWGVLAIPRVGQEVLVDFLDGDPDQPIVTGRTYHATQLPPGTLPSSKTQMAFRSKTYKGEGYNELLFEDATGKEQLNLHAQRDMTTTVLNDRNTKVLGNHSEVVNNQQKIDIICDNYAEITSDLISQIKQQTINIEQNYRLLIDGDVNFSSDKSIILKTKNSHITILTNKINITSLINVQANGEEIYFN